MSLAERNWDIRSPSSPRSFCIFESPKSDSSNPFEDASSPNQAVVFGTERGSLHYRVFGFARETQPLEKVNQANVVKGSIVSIQRISSRNVFLLLVDDNRGSSQTSGTYAAILVSFRHGQFAVLPTQQLPRMSCATYSKSTGIVYAFGRTIASITPEFWGVTSSPLRPFTLSNCLPAVGSVRAGPHALSVVAHGKVVVVAIQSTFYAVPTYKPDAQIKLLTVQQSSQVHPVLIEQVQDPTLEPTWSTLVLASGREASVVDLQFLSEENIHSVARDTTTLPSPILNMASLYPWVALLTSDGLVSLREATSIAIPLRTMEVGTQPNDFFSLKGFQTSGSHDLYMASLSYSGDCKVLPCLPDTDQDLADRFMKLSINAFGSAGFPRAQVAETLQASFTATSYVGPEPSAASRKMLQDYLETTLGLTEFVSGAKIPERKFHRNTILCGTALLCLVASNSGLANRAARQAQQTAGVWYGTEREAIVQICTSVAETLLRQASQNISLLQGPNKSYSSVELVEAAAWLLRASGRHEESIQILKEKLQSNDGMPHKWSDIKYESHLATYLSELWANDGSDLVLRLDITRELLQRNPRLGLSVFTSLHPHNETQWKNMLARDDPIHAHPKEVVSLLKSIVPFNTKEDLDDESKSGAVLPLTSGRALAVSYVESAIGIDSERPTQQDVFDTLELDTDVEEKTANLHDELSFLLLEGIVSERGDDDGGQDTALGKIYRNKLQKLLRWPLAKVRSERLLASLPSSFLEEHALLLGRLGRHEDALRILYVECKSLDLALQYCDTIHERQEQQQKGVGNGGECAYLPLVKVALRADPDPEQSAAIKVLALRSGSIDRAAALRLLPQSVPVSAVARPFLIPALVDSESEIRRLKVVSALLRAKYISLKQKLTDAQIKAQSTLGGVPQLRAMRLGDPLHSSKAIKARPSQTASTTFPDVQIIKHYFPRHLVVQAKTTNSAASVEGRTLGNLAFVVAESSDEAIQTSLNVPLKALPYLSTGSCWCVLQANAARMDSVVVLTCELRYTVFSMDTTTLGTPLTYSAGGGRTYVEELQDMEVHAAHFA